MKRVTICFIVVCFAGIVVGQTSSSSSSSVEANVGSTTNVGSNAGGSINNQSGAQSSSTGGSVSGVSSASQGGAASSMSQGGGVDFDYSPTSISKYPTAKMGLVNPVHPNPPWQYPFNPEFWNGVNADPKIYQRWWEPTDTKPALKKIRNRGLFGLAGDGFRHEISLDDYGVRPARKSARIFTITQSVDMGKLFQSYECVGVIVVTGDVRRHFDQVARKVIDIALRYDIDVAYLSGALNPVNDGATMSGPGAGAATAGTQYSLSLIGGALSTKSKVLGEPYVCLQCFKKIPESMRETFVKYVPPLDVTAALDGGGNIAPPQPLKPTRPEAPTPPVLEELSDKEESKPVGPALSSDGIREELEGINSDPGIVEEEERPVVMVSPIVIR